MTPIQMPRRARLPLSRLLAGGTAGIMGFLAAPALAQAAQTVAGGGPVTWDSLGLGGLAVALSIWGMRESDKKRLEESQRYAQDLAALGEQRSAEIAEFNERRLDEEREHRAAVERIYASKVETYRQMVEFYERSQQERQKMLQELLQRVLESTATRPSGAAPGGTP